MIETTKSQRKSQQQTEHEMFMEIIAEECAIDITKPISYPPVALSMGEMELQTKNGIKMLPLPIGTYGNFSFVQAPPKTKKTFFISLLASVYIGGTNNFGGKLCGHRDDRSLLHIDTEQSHWHSQRVFSRVSDMNENKNNDKYHTFALRTIGFKERIELIEYLLSEKYPDVGLVIIDGIADLVSDVNNLEESNRVVQKIMEWSAKYKCHIVTVIHSNFGSDKPTGHLGSFLEKKTETQIQLETNNVNKDWITVKCKRSRGYAFETFSFKVNKIGLPVIIGDLYDPLKSNYPI